MTTFHFPVATLVCLSFTLLMPVLAHAAPLGEAKDIEFTSTLDKTTQLYAERLPADFDAAKEHHLLIALHGHGSDRTQGVSTRAEFQAAQDIAAKYDMIYVSPDYRAKTSWMGPKAEADMLQIIADLKRKYRVGKVFLTGASMGGSSVLTFTALHPDLIAGVASQNGTANHIEYTNFQTFIAESFGGTKEQIPDEYNKRSAENWPDSFTMPVAIAAGGKDTTVPATSVLRLAKVLKVKGRPVLLLFRPTEGHVTSYADTAASLEFVISTALGLPTPPEPK